MTCEFCGISNVGIKSYEVPEMTKVDACRPCIRAFDNFLKEVKDQYLQMVNSDVRGYLETNMKFPGGKAKDAT